MTRISTRFAVPAAGVLLATAALSFQPSLAQAPAPGSTIALTGGRVIDGTGAAPLPQATIVITNGRIAAVGAPPRSRFRPARPGSTCPARRSCPA